MSYRKTKIKETAKHSGITKLDLALRVITVDYERYAHMLEDADLSEDQKREFLQTIWNIIVEFVSLGFGVHPLQQVQNSCGERQDITSKPTLTAPDGVYLDHQYLEENFTNAADLETEPADEGAPL